MLLFQKNKATFSEETSRGIITSDFVGFFDGRRKVSMVFRAMKHFGAGNKTVHRQDRHGF